MPSGSSRGITNTDEWRRELCVILFIIIPLLFRFFIKEILSIKYYNLWTSDHPSTVFPDTYVGLYHSSSGSSKVVQTSLSLATFSSSSWGIPRPDEIWSRSSLGPSTSWMSQEDLQLKAPRRQLPPISKPALDIAAPQPISEVKPIYPAEENHLSHLYTDLGLSVTT